MSRHGTSISKIKVETVCDNPNQEEPNLQICTSKVRLRIVPQCMLIEEL